MKNLSSITSSPLGKETTYVTNYSPSLLHPIPRRIAREEIGLGDSLPFEGVDIWNAYELSWLNPKGKPEVELAEFHVPCDSENLVESKSLKLYLNSLNQTRFSSSEEVGQLLQKDLSEACKGNVVVKIISPHILAKQIVPKFSYTYIDELDIDVETYDVASHLLKVGDGIVTEKLFTNLFKTNCLVTGQPDWATLFLHYKGRQIDHGSLLKYIISYRSHQGFHEECVERIFFDIQKYCKPDHLTVYARYTRRGGLDINPYRSNFEPTPQNLRVSRQ